MLFEGVKVWIIRISITCRCVGKSGVYDVIMYVNACFFFKAPLYISTDFWRFHVTHHCFFKFDIQHTNILCSVILKNQVTFCESCVAVHSARPTVGCRPLWTPSRHIKLCFALLCSPWKFWHKLCQIITKCLTNNCHLQYL